MPPETKPPKPFRGGRTALLLTLGLPLGFFTLQWAADSRADMSAWGFPEWKVFLTGSLWSLCFWGSLILWGSWWTWKGGHNRKVAFGLGAMTAVWVLAAYFTSYMYLRDMYHLPNVHILRFTLYESANAWALAKEVLKWWHLGVAVPAAAASAWWLGMHLLSLGLWLKGLRPWARRGLLGLVSVSFVTLSVLTLGWHRYQDPLPWDANWHRMFFQYGLFLAGNTTNLQVAHREPLPSAPSGAKPKHNVLVILNESLRADAIFPRVDLFEGFHGDTLAPRVWGRVSTDSQYYLFPHAYANAGATNASVPSLTTGLSPEASTYDFHRYPTVWNIAKSLGYHTFAFTPQDWRWEHFDEFFLDRDVDAAIHRRHFPAYPLVNDLGIDDIVVVDSLLRYLAGRPALEPFFGVMQFNVTHPPFYGGPASLALPIVMRPRYRMAVDLLDRYTDSLLAGLERLDRFDNTLIVYISDHGENIRSRSLARLGSFHDESLRIPFWVKPPKDSSWIASHEISLRNLRAWTGSTVQNLDIVPTLLDFWSLPGKSPFGNYDGKSLLGPGAGVTRVISAQNTGEIRAWQPEGCFVLRAPVKLVLANHTPPQLFDIAKDPQEQVNLWGVDSLRHAMLPWAGSYMRALKGRMELCRRLKATCPQEILMSSQPDG